MEDGQGVKAKRWSGPEMQSGCLAQPTGPRDKLVLIHHGWRRGIGKEGFTDSMPIRFEH